MDKVIIFLPNRENNLVSFSLEKIPFSLKLLT